MRQQEVMAGCDSCSFILGAENIMEPMVQRVFVLGLSVFNLIGTLV